jgi:hypothetical protein
LLSEQGISFDEQGIEIPKFPHNFCTLVSPRTDDLFSPSIFRWEKRYGERATIERALRRAVLAGIESMQYCEVHDLSRKAFENWCSKFKTEPEAPKPMLYRRGDLSHRLSHTLSHGLVI